MVLALMLYILALDKLISMWYVSLIDTNALWKNPAFPSFHLVYRSICSIVSLLNTMLFDKRSLAKYHCELIESSLFLVFCYIF